MDVRFALDKHLSDVEVALLAGLGKRRKTELLGEKRHGRAHIYQERKTRLELARRQTNVSGAC
jgi:hypothetical protein